MLAERLPAQNHQQHSSGRAATRQRLERGEVPTKPTVFAGLKTTGRQERPVSRLPQHQRTLSFAQLGSARHHWRESVGPPATQSLTDMIRSATVMTTQPRLEMMPGRAFFLWR
jgi:hypothetical protein